jgi:hypothetical protein
MERISFFCRSQPPDSDQHVAIKASAGSESTLIDEAKLENTYIPEVQLCFAWFQLEYKLIRLHVQLRLETKRLSISYATATKTSCRSLLPGLRCSGSTKLSVLLREPITCHYNLIGKHLARLWHNVPVHCQVEFLAL